MDLLKLLLSALQRVVTAISAPFRMLLVRARRLFNVNVLTAKLIQPLTKHMKRLLRLRPTQRSDYVSVGRFLVFKQLPRLLVVALCAGIFIYFSAFAQKVESIPADLSEIKTDTTFAYDDLSVQDFTGLANITAYDGSVIYTGAVEQGVCTGAGLLYDRDGNLVYQGEFDQNVYSGSGTRYHPDGGVEYEGEFAGNLYHGSGKHYDLAGGLLYEGGFAGGLYDGDGKLYGQNGGLLYEGGFSQGLRQGSGSEYGESGALRYKVEFFGGLFQGQGQLYGGNGRSLYTGVMLAGAIHYRSLVGATLQEVEAAFHETPAIFYTDDGNSCFYFEWAGVIVTTDCRVKVHEWERERENPSDGYYYLPADDTLPWAEDDAETPEAAAGVAEMAALPGGVFPAVMPVGWVIIDPYNPESSSSSESSSGSSSSGSSESSAASSASESSGDETSSQAGEGGTSAASREDSAASRADLPEFVEKTKQLYFEVDKDVWQTEETLDKSKVSIRQVTVLEERTAPENGTEQPAGNRPPGVEDCVAIDSIRRSLPTAFGDILFEVDNQNKLFRRIWNINHAGLIRQEVFLADDVLYRLCYLPDSDEAPVYYTIESA